MGSIHSPAIGRNQRRPPTVSNNPAGILSQRLDGFRRKRSVERIRLGERFMSSSRRQSSALTARVWTSFATQRAEDNRFTFLLPSYAHSTEAFVEESTVFSSGEVMLNSRIRSITCASNFRADVVDSHEAPPRNCAMVAPKELRSAKLGDGNLWALMSADPCALRRCDPTSRGWPILQRPRQRGPDSIY